MTGIVAIRRLILDDMDIVADIYRQSFGQRLPWLSDSGTRDEDRLFFRETVFPQSTLWGATENGRIVGFAAVRDVWLDHLYVLPEFQSRGVGSLLLRHCQMQSEELKLWTFQQNCGADRFYENHGFERLPAETDGDGETGGGADGLFRWKRKPGVAIPVPIEGIVGV